MDSALVLAVILTGQEPDGLSLKKLHRLPMEWDGQRKVLGIMPPASGRETDQPK